MKALRVARLAMFGLAALGLATATVLTSAGPAWSGDAKAKTGKAKLTPGQQQQVRDIVRKYLIEHPEIIVEAIQALRKRQAAAQAKQQKEALKTHRAAIRDDKDSPVGGNPKGNITIIEFFDYRCGYCKLAKPHLDKVLAEDGNVRVVFKEFPILGPASRYAAHAALAARAQGKYMAFHDALMAYKGNLTPPIVLTIAKAVNLDIDRLKRDMATPEIKGMIQRNLQLANKLGIRGTPTFIIGDKVVPQAMNETMLKKTLAQARKACKTAKC